MNTKEHTPEEKAALHEFVAADKEGEAGLAPYVQAAPEAMRRLARAGYGHDNSQAQTVAACLASGETTRDLGGALSTEEAGRAAAARLRS